MSKKRYQLTGVVLKHLNIVSIVQDNRNISTESCVIKAASGVCGFKGFIYIYHKLFMFEPCVWSLLYFTSLHTENNINIFRKVQQFIQTTGRF